MTEREEGITLWSINRWFRWSGFVLVVTTSEGGPTRLCLPFVGWPPDAAWVRRCERMQAELDAKTAKVELPPRGSAEGWARLSKGGDP